MKNRRTIIIDGLDKDLQRSDIKFNYNRGLEDYNNLTINTTEKAKFKIRKSINHFRDSSKRITSKIVTNDKITRRTRMKTSVNKISFHIRRPKKRYSNEFRKFTVAVDPKLQSKIDY